jgi:hypothetical protein
MNKARGLALIAVVGIAGCHSTAFGEIWNYEVIGTVTNNALPEASPWYSAEPGDAVRFEYSVDSTAEPLFVVGDPPWYAMYSVLDGAALTIDGITRVAETLPDPLDRQLHITNDDPYSGIDQYGVLVNALAFGISDPIEFVGQFSFHCTDHDGTILDTIDLPQEIPLSELEGSGGSLHVAGGTLWFSVDEFNLIPAPSTLALFGLMGVVRRRRQRL